jgi:hypothetical protein
MFITYFCLIYKLVIRISANAGLEYREYDRRDPSLWPRGTFYPQKFGTNFSDKRSLGRYISLADSDQARSLAIFISGNETVI